MQLTYKHLACKCSFHLPFLSVQRHLYELHRKQRLFLINLEHMIKDLGFLYFSIYILFSYILLLNTAGAITSQCLLNFWKPVFRCTFTVLTADGCLHNIEISQEPSASISSACASSSGLTSRRQFPQNVFCVDYCPELSLLVVVSSVITTSLTSSGNTGIVSYHLLFFCSLNGTF